ncbi:two-component system, OmpR family, sensor histidine kinase TctE [Kushneria avicenniae]|uniref:histidine kinase n=1 Tax=Kushneria avicenniae TaxID=402385 RepID=A0A1I1JCM5_9GAMM|nr:sensor histidine kinase [Kushneria avicenniae]SFC43180.1 two-component system, OmpR family, sensor histidine kinase TctE [Kushneria avicenniae]
MKTSLSPRSLRGRLTRRIGAALLLLIGVGVAGAWLDAWRVASSAYDRPLLIAARVLGDSLTVQDGEVQVRISRAVLDPFSLDSGGSAFYQVITPEQGSVAGFEDLPAPPSSVAMTTRYPSLARFYNATYGGRDVRVVSLLVPVSQPGYQGMVEIRVAEHRDIHAQLMHDLLGDSLIRLTLFAIGAFILFLLAIDAALRPLRRITDMVASRSPDNLEPLPTENVQREVRGLIEAINHLTARLDDTLRAQRAFVADAAHEIRTPLFALRARLELGMQAHDSDALRATLESVQRDLEALTLLANRLLSLARVENDIRRRDFGVLDLSETAREFCMSMVSLAWQRGLTLALEAEDPVRVHADSALINELLAIVIGNAQAYTPAGGHITVRVLPEAVIEVEDDGPGIPESERERVFERFYRARQTAQPAEDSDRAISGTGLGLAIARQICTALGAGISLHEGACGGTLARVTFRVAVRSPAPGLRS